MTDKASSFLNLLTEGLSHPMLHQAVGIAGDYIKKPASAIKVSVSQAGPPVEDLDIIRDAMNFTLIENGVKRENPRSYKIKGDFNYHVVIQITGAPRLTPSSIEINAYHDERRKHSLDVNYRWIQIDKDGDSCNMNLQINKYEVSPRDIGKRIRVYIDKAKGGGRAAECIFEYGPVLISEYQNTRFMSIRDVPEQAVGCKVRLQPDGLMFDNLFINDNQVMPYTVQERGPTFHWTVESYCSPSLVDSQLFKIIPHQGAELLVRMNTAEERDILILYIKNKIIKIREEVGLADEKFCRSFMDYSKENISSRVLQKEELDTNAIKQSHDASFSSASPLMTSLNPQNNYQQRSSNTSHMSHQILVPQTNIQVLDPLKTNGFNPLMTNLGGGTSSILNRTLSPEIKTPISTIRGSRNQIQGTYLNEPYQYQNSPIIKLQPIKSAGMGALQLRRPEDVPRVVYPQQEVMTLPVQSSPIYHQYQYSQMVTEQRPVVLRDTSNQSISMIAQVAPVQQSPTEISRPCTVQQTKTESTLVLEKVPQKVQEEKSPGMTLASYLGSQVSNVWQNLSSSPETAVFASKLATMINKGELKKEVLLESVQKLAGASQAQAKKSLIQLVSNAEKQFDSSLDMSNPSAILENYDLEGVGEKPGMFDKLMNKVKKMYHVGIGDSSPSLNILEDLEKASDEVGKLKAKNKELFSKLAGIYQGKQGVSDSDSFAQNTEIQLKDSKIKKIAKEKDSLKAELEDFQEQNSNLQAALDKEKAKQRTKENQWKRRQAEWLEEKEELESKLIEAESYKSKAEGLRHTIKTLTDERQQLHDELDSVRYSRVEESRRDTNGVEKLLRKKLENSKKDIELLKEKLEEKTQELLDQEIEFNTQIDFLNKELTASKDQNQFQSTLRNPPEGTSPSSSRLFDTFKLTICQALSDYHDISLSDKPTDMEIIQSIESLAHSHQDRIAELQDRMMAASACECGKKGRRDTDKQAEIVKEDDVQRLRERVKELEMEVKRGKNAGVKPSDNSFNSHEVLFDSKQSPILGASGFEKMKHSKETEDRLSREKFMLEVELSNTQSQLKSALEKLEKLSIQHENTQPIQASNIHETQIAHLRYALDRAHEEIKTLKNPKL